MTHHSINIRIYYEDTDAGGVVYHASYLKFGERGRTEFLRHLGHQNTTLGEDYNILFVVKHIEIEYLKPAFLDDILREDTAIETMKNTSFTMRQVFYRGEDKVCEMHVALVCVDSNTIKPVRLPDVIQKEFKAFIEVE